MLAQPDLLEIGIRQHLKDSQVFGGKRLEEFGDLSGSGQMCTLGTLAAMGLRVFYAAVFRTLRANTTLSD